MLANIILNGIMVGSLYGLIAIGFILIYKATGVFNMAQGEMVMVGGYFFWWGMAALHLPAFWAIILALILSGLLAIVIERVAIRPLIGQPLLSVVMMTIAIAMILRGGSMIVWTAQVQRTAKVFPENYITLGNIFFAPYLVIGFALSLAALLIFTFFFSHTKIGLMMRCTSDNQLGARSIGISVSKITVLTWIISAFTATVVAFVLGTGMGTISVDLAELGMKALAVALLAGLQSLPGAVIGGAILGVGENVAGVYIDPLVDGGMKDLFPYLLMMAILMIRPYGLFGLKQIERV